MKIIQKMAEMIIDEAEGAEHYAKKAIMYKDERPALGKMFFTLANEELGHVNALHGAVVDLINEYKQKNGDPPEGMMAVYNYLHDKQIKHVADVNALLAEYRA